MVDCSCQQARTSKQRQNCIISNRSAPELKKKDTRSALFLFPFPPPAKSDSSRLPSDFSCQHIHPLRQNIHTAFLGSNRTLHRYDFISRRTFTVAVVQLESRAPYGPLLLGLFAQLHNSRVRLFQLALCLIFPSRLLGRLDDFLPLHLSKEAQQLTHHIVRLPDPNHPFNLSHHDNNARPPAHPRTTKKESISQKRRKGSPSQPNLEQEST